jgi:hypothetical protein
MQVTLVPASLAASGVRGPASPTPPRPPATKKTTPDAGLWTPCFTAGDCGLQFTAGDPPTPSRGYGRASCGGKKQRLTAPTLGRHPLFYHVSPGRRTFARGYDDRPHSGGRLLVVSVFPLGRQSPAVDTRRLSRNCMQVTPVPASLAASGVRSPASPPAAPPQQKKRHRTPDPGRRVLPQGTAGSSLPQRTRLRPHMATAGKLRAPALGQRRRNPPLPCNTKNQRRRRIIIAPPPSIIRTSVAGSGMIPLKLKLDKSKKLLPLTPSVYAVRLLGLRLD